MSATTVTPAYGRDYTSLAKAQADWDAGKDFIIQDIMDPYDGKPCNKEDMKDRHVNVRYGRLRKIGRLQ